MTGLMYNRRVSKCDARVEAYGAVDELNAGLGVARAATTEPFICMKVLEIQKHLVILMGELATAPADLKRYEADGFSLLRPEMTTGIENMIREAEALKVSIHGWATPGATPLAAALDLARTICRRAERRVCELQQNGTLHNQEIIIYLNRLADLLWLLARWAESPR